MAGEVVLALYFLACLMFAVRFGYWIAVPFLAVFFQGFASTAALSATSWWTSRRPPSLPDGSPG